MPKIIVRDLHVKFHIAITSIVNFSLVSPNGVHLKLNLGLTKLKFRTVVSAMA